jgi:signal transduction histidine kinase
MKRRITLRTQFILLIVLGLSALFVVITVVVAQRTTQNLRTSLTSQSKSFAALATKPIGDTFVTYQDSGRIKIIQQVEKFTDLDTNISNVSVVDIGGKTLYEQNEGTNVTVNAQQASSFDTVLVTDHGKLTRVITPYIEDFGAHRYSIVYDVSYKAIDQSIRQLTTGIIFLAFGALILSIAISYFFINRLFLDPVRQVSNAAIAISKGDLDKKIEPKRNDEIGDLATSVNTMADALKADIQKLRDVDAIKTEFMMIASHNLRTPLTIIQGYLDTLLLNKELPQDVRGTVEVVAASGNRLSVFAEDILTVSRLEAGENVMKSRYKTDLKELLERIANDFRSLAKEKKLDFQVLLPDHPCYSIISMPHIRAAIWNLLDNAVKFTKEGSITLKLEVQAGKASISVSDTGTGIDPEEVPKLFTKFHRGTSTEQYDYEGSGIGLYLTKLIVDQHGGTIAVDSKLGKGTTFMVVLPIISEHPDQKSI